MVFPFITLIVISKNRDNYLIQAVKSALNQTLDKSLYEVIVVKNSIDGELDQLLLQMGVNVLHVDGKSTGAKVIEALGSSRGEILSFLEDDDLFEENKLQEIYDIFQDKKIGYVHNNITAIEKSGKFLPSFVKGNFDHFKYVEEPSYKSEVRKIVYYNIDFNLSSISVRKTILENTAEYWKRLKSTSDSFLFYSALLSKMAIVASNKPLTRYRIHGDSLTNHLGGFDDFINKKTHFLRTMICDYSVIMEMIRGTKFEKFAKKVMVQKIISLGIYSPENEYKLKIGDYFSIFRPFHFREVFGYDTLLLFGCSFAKLRRRPVIKASYFSYKKMIDRIFSKVEARSLNYEFPVNIIR